MIPKIIHYCWFGDKDLNKIQNDCIASWRRHMPEYKIVLWNEHNVDLGQPFLKYAYHHKKWAYVSDYVRLKVLKDFGGIYLDTDMYVIKNLDNLLSKECFFGAETNSLINAAIVGACKGNFFIGRCMQYYEGKIEDYMLRLAIPRVITREFEKLTKNKNINIQDIIEENGVIIYPTKYFYPMPFIIDRPFDRNFIKYANPETFAIHLWDGSWIEYSEFQLLRKKEYLRAFKLIFKSKEINIKYFLKVIKTLIKSFL